MELFALKALSLLIISLATVLGAAFSLRDFNERFIRAANCIAGLLL